MKLPSKSLRAFSVRDCSPDAVLCVFVLQRIVSDSMATVQISKETECTLDQ